MISDLSSTFTINGHSHGRPVIVHDKYRCGGRSGCGHRLAINGVPPVQSRELPVRTWHRELLDRRAARAQS